MNAAKLAVLVVLVFITVGIVAGLLMRETAIQEQRPIAESVPMEPPPQIGPIPPVKSDVEQQIEDSLRQLRLHNQSEAQREALLERIESLSRLEYRFSLTADPRIVKAWPNIDVFRGELKQGSFGFFPHKPSRVVRILGAQSAIVTMTLKDEEEDEHVIISGYYVGERTANDPIKLFDPFEVAGTREIEGRSYVILQHHRMRPR